MAVLAFMGHAGLSVAMILPGAVVHFFCLVQLQAYAEMPEADLKDASLEHWFMELQ